MTNIICPKSNVFLDKTLDRAMHTGEAQYVKISTPFMANVGVEKKSSHAKWTFAEVNGRQTEYYRVGKKGPRTNILNLEFYGITERDIGKTTTFICQLMAVATPDGNWYLFLKLVKKAVENWRKFPVLTVDTQLQEQFPKRIVETWQAYYGPDQETSPRILLRERKGGKEREDWVDCIAVDSDCENHVVVFLYKILAESIGNFFLWKRFRLSYSQ